MSSIYMGTFYLIALTIIILFLIPWAVFLLLYFESIYLHYYKRRHNLDDNFSLNIWKYAKRHVANLWLLHGAIFHGYEIVGLENIPINKPAILLLFHGTVPVDLYCLVTLLANHPHLKLSTIGDKFLYKVPGLALLMRVLNVYPGTFESCCNDLKQGKLLIISPGGAREAVFSDKNYTILWNQRCGFAKIALSQNVPVIPAFTQNIREGYRVATFGFGRLFREYYERRRLPLIPMYGGFPVKMKTIIGKPIYPEDVFKGREFTIHSQLSNNNNVDHSDKYGDSPRTRYKALHESDRNCTTDEKMSADFYDKNSQTTLKNDQHGRLDSIPNNNNNKTDTSPDVVEFAEVCKNALRDLIDSHQTLPGSIISGLMQRLTDNPFPFTFVDSDFKCKYWESDSSGIISDCQADKKRN